MEGQHASLTQAQEYLRQRLERTDSALADAQNAQKEVEEKASASARALAEVRRALNFTVDTVNPSSFFTE